MTIIVPALVALLISEHKKAGAFLLPPADPFQ